MDILEFAMQMEKDGERYYHGLEKNSSNKKIGNIFNELAENELTHYEIFKAMKKGQTPVPAGTTVIENAKNIFSGLDKEAFKNREAPAEVETYLKALAMEKKSIEFYEEKSGELKDKAQQSILGKIIEEERRHYFLLENMVEFVNSPYTWLENAEWNNLNEY
jgi:rubrerythrin